MSESSDHADRPVPGDVADEEESEDRQERDPVDPELVESERAATHRATEDMAPGVIKDSHGEIQPDPYPDRPEHAGDEGPDRDVIEQHREDAHDLEEHRTSAANETLGTVTDQGEPDPDTDAEPTGG